MGSKVKYMPNIDFFVTKSQEKNQVDARDAHDAERGIIL
jgi:hypothetical protein